MATAVNPACPAYCCEAFHVATEAIGWLWEEPENVRDGVYLREMLVEIDPAEAQRLHRDTFGLVGWVPDEGEHYFTCKHWDPATRLCTDYVNRPQMCRDHPCGTCKFGCGVFQ